MICGKQKDELRRLLLTSGAVKAGFAKADAVGNGWVKRFDSWLEAGYNAELDYMHNYPEIRRDVRLLMPGVQTVAVLAFNYYQKNRRAETLPAIAMYAYGKDYHDVIRRRLKPICEKLKSDFNMQTRVCIDSAPVAERYWAEKAGIGFRGKNGMIIVPEFGSFVFLAEVMMSVAVEADTPLSGDCGECNNCVSRCPAAALRGDGTLDARRCLSCQTIEHRGNFDAPWHRPGTQLPLYGCDCCQNVCPYNNNAPANEIEEFAPTDEFLTLDAEKLDSMTQEDFSRLFRGSAVKRAKYDGLMRNWQFIKSEQEK